MVLNDEQCNRFFDVMDSLLYYVNERFRVVEQFTLDMASPIDDIKVSLVARALWDNVEIIDDFIRDNPMHLSKKCLEVAEGWKFALPGFYTVVRYQAGKALLMNDVGVFSVCGVTDELDGQIGPVPAYVEMVLLPFDDLIVYDGFLQAYDTAGTASELSRIQDEFEDRCVAGVVQNAADFCLVAQAHIAVEREKEFDALLEEASRESEDREERLPAGYHRGVLAGLSPEDRAAAKAASARPSQVEAAKSRAQLGRSGASGEPKRRFDHFDLQCEQALTCAVACVLYCGVAAVDDVYAQYRALVSDVLDRNEFDALIDDEASYADADFSSWSFRQRNYIVHYTLTPDYVAQEFAYYQSRSMVSFFRNQETGEFAFESGGNAAGYLPESLAAELEFLEQFKCSLVESQSNLPMRPLSRTLLENDVLTELFDDPNVVRLRDYLDAHVPDGADDFTFADHAASEFALAAVESGSLEALYSYASDLGLDGCIADDPRFALLVTNLYNAMPSWENNGWSPQELYEQLTGRKMFYNDDGSVVRVGADDLCPCGSGKKYRDCCGR